MEMQLQRIIADIHTLSSEEFGGRLSGTEGARQAAHFLASILEQNRFLPIGTNGYFTPVNVPAARLHGPVRLRIGDREFIHRLDFGETAPYSGGGVVTGELRVIRDGQTIDPAHLSHRIVLIAERPEGFDLKHTVISAAELGISALLIEHGEPRWFHKTVFGAAENRIPVIRVRRSVAKELEDMDGAMVQIELPLVSSSLPCQNVMGILYGSRKEHTVVLSAHYDHLGDDPQGQRFPGSIDNASGVAVLLEMARMAAKAEEPLPFNLLVAFLTGEESGMWGARHLVSNPPLPLSAAINVDSLGFEPDLFALRVGHTKPGDWLANTAANLIEQINIEAKWIVGGDDSAAFREKGIPTVGLGQKPTTAIATPIHTPYDNPEHLHEKPLQLGLKVVEQLIASLAKDCSWQTTDPYSISS